MNQLVKAQSTAVASLPADADPFAMLADQEVGLDASLVKFRRGIWSVGPDEAVVKADQRFIAIMTELLHGFIKWEEGKVVERHMVRVVDSRAPERAELGDMDESNWPTGPNGREDPWAFCYELPLVDAETNGARLYSTSTTGGKRAVGKLSRAYSQHRRKAPGELPAIELACDTYKHELYGVVQNPVLKVVDWTKDPDKPSTPAQPAEPGLDDEIPF